MVAEDVGPVQILTLDGSGDSSVELLLDNLDSISEALKKERCDYVSIISVMGTYRTGKSFLLDLLMRYLRTRAIREDKEEENENEQPNNGLVKEAAGKKPKTPWTLGTEEEMPLPEWVRQGDATHISEGAKGVSCERGFGWRSGKDKCTNGIWLWSKPFVLHDLKGRRIGVLLMDTQGAWDDKMSKDQSATIFGLTALLSSKLIYNIQNRIEEDKLENLDYFTSFAEKACGVVHQGADNASSKPPFGHLELLIRDWANYDDGWTLGQCKAQMSEHLDDHLNPDKVPGDAKERVGRLRSCFGKVDCFGLVHPGIPVTKPKYEGKIADIEPDFMHLLDSFTEVFFGDSFPCPSAPLGCELTTAAFTQTVRNFAEAFANSRGMAMGLREAFVKVQMMQEREQLLKSYRAWIYNQYPEHTVIDPAELEKEMAVQKGEYQKRLINMLKPFRLKDEQETEFVDALMSDIDIVNGSRSSSNEAQVEGATMKVVAAPVVGFGVWFAACHAWLVAMGTAVGGWASMKKHSRKHDTELLHPRVLQGLMEDVKKFGLNRWKDVQAMQIAVHRIELDKVLQTLMGMGMKATANIQAATAAGKEEGDGLKME
jgi:hypothetical protein